jgi:hypothetical protein
VSAPIKSALIRVDDTYPEYYTVWKLLEAEEISRTTLQEAVATSVYSKIQPVRIDGGREAERLCSDPG